VSDVLGLPAALVGLRRCLVMGVVNVTPDSFSDGGQWFEPAQAIAHGLALVEQGADILDIGGESTRPGAGRIPVDEELRRVMPVVRELAAVTVVSIDTTRAEVADAALSAGAALVNDVTAGSADPAMADLVAQAGVPFVAMHSRGSSEQMEDLAVYHDAVAEVCAELSARLAHLVDRGVDPRQVVLDPGFGFAKRPEHSWQLFAALDRLLALGRPVLVGTSRKRFLSAAVGRPGGGPADRDDATAATTALAAAAGAWGVRVHCVQASADAVRVAAAVAAATSSPEAAATPAAGRP